MDDHSLLLGAPRGFAGVMGNAYDIHDVSYRLSAGVTEAVGVVGRRSARPRAVVEERITIGP